MSLAPSPSHPSRTLVTLPPEVQGEIFSELDHLDLLTICHVSHSTRAVALRLFSILDVYSFSELATFFLPPANLPVGSTAALNIAEWKRAHWECLRHVELGEPDGDWRAMPTLDPLSPSIGGRPATPIRLDRLRLTTWTDKSAFLDRLLPFLRSFRPTLVELQVKLARERLARLPAETAWEDVTELAIAGMIRKDNVPTIEDMGSAARFDRVKSVTLTYSKDYSNWPIVPVRAHLEADLLLLLRLCPNMEAPVHISTPDGDSTWDYNIVDTMKEVIRDGLGGRPASFFEIRERDYLTLFGGFGTDDD